MKFEEVESTHSLVQDNHLAGREAVAVGEDLEDWVEAAVAAFDVVVDHVDPIEGEEAQDPAHLVFLPLFHQISCWDRGRLMAELVEMNPHFEGGHRFLGREDYHL
jgi:hypothetical protein